MTSPALRTPSVNSSGITANQIRLLVPLGCPGNPVWVPPNEVQRWEQLGFYRAQVPAGELELCWNPIGRSIEGVIPVELVVNSRVPPPNAVTVDWGDGTVESMAWPSSGGDGNLRLRHDYSSRMDYTIQAELVGQPGGDASLLVSLAGCSIWKPEPTPPPDGGGSGTLQPLIPGAGLTGVPYDGSATVQFGLRSWPGGNAVGGVPGSRGDMDSFLRADGQWVIPAGGSGGTIWFNGNGAPSGTAVATAKVGDYYLDGVSGLFYLLQ